MEKDYRIFPYGDAALILETAEEISESAYRRIRGIAETIAVNQPKGLKELIPAYRSLLVVYDPLVSDFASLESQIISLAARAAESPEPAAQIVCIPVCYKSPYAMDMADVARHTGLMPEEIVALHSSETYLVYMLGFTPGFPYLGGMTERIAAPRRSSPRTRIPAGSVGIADRQTGIYPLESPGGWNIIGRTPAVLFDYSREPPALLRAGQYIRFHPISSNEFVRIEQEISRGVWTPDIEKTHGGAS